MNGGGGRGGRGGGEGEGAGGAARREWMFDVSEFAADPVQAEEEGAVEEKHATAGAAGAAAFNAAAFVSKYKHAIPLPQLRDELQAYLAHLKGELYALINRDYVDFIGIVTRLEGVDARVFQLKQPLLELQALARAMNSSVSASREAIEARVAEAQRLARRKRLLKQALTCMEQMDIADAELGLSSSSSSTSSASISASGSSASTSTSASASSMGDGKKTRKPVAPGAHREPHCLVASHRDPLIARAAAFERIAHAVVRGRRAILESEREHGSSTTASANATGQASSSQPASASDVALLRTLRVRVQSMDRILTTQMCDSLHRACRPTDPTGATPFVVNRTALRHVARALVALGHADEAERTFRQAVVKPVLHANLSRAQVDGASGGEFAGLRDALQRTFTCLQACCQSTLVALEDSTALSHTLLSQQQQQQQKQQRQQQQQQQSTYRGDKDGGQQEEETKADDRARLLGDVGCRALNSAFVFRDSPTVSASELPDTECKEQSTIAYHPPLDLFVRGVWQAVYESIVDSFEDMFTLGLAYALHDCYTASMQFVEQLCDLCGPEHRSVFRARLHADNSIRAFADKWNLPVYFQLRFTEITGAIDHAIRQVEARGVSTSIEHAKDGTGGPAAPAPLHQEGSITVPKRSSGGGGSGGAVPGTVTASFARPTGASGGSNEGTGGGARVGGSAASLAERNAVAAWEQRWCGPLLSQLQLDLTRVLARQMAKCWCPAIVLSPLTHKFSTLSVQILRALTQWTAAGASSAEGTLLRADTEEVVLFAHDYLLLVNWAGTALPDMAHETVGAGAGVAENAGEQARALIHTAVSAECAAARDTVQRLWRHTGATLATQCSVALQGVRGITATYRMTNKPAPTQPSSYVATVLNPARGFLEQHDRHVPDFVRGWWLQEMCDTISRRYLESIQALTEQVTQMESALRRRKAKRRTADTSGAAGVSDAAKIMLQVHIDVTAFRDDWRRLGLQDEGRAESGTGSAMQELMAHAERALRAVQENER